MPQQNRRAVRSLAAHLKQWVNWITCKDRPARQVGLLLGLFAAYYIRAYFKNSVVPSVGVDFPTGWWTWFDQGFYLRAAKATSHWNWAAEHYFYPPLYPALGTPFVRLWPNHPFLLINLGSSMVFAYVFFCVGRRYFSAQVAAAIFFVFMMWDSKIFEQLLIPWSTTAVAAFLSVGIWTLSKINSDQPGTSQGLRRIWYFSVFSLGLVIATRPPDAALAGIICFALTYELFRIDRRLLTWRTLTLGGLLASVGGALHLGFNNAVHGSFQGAYLNLASSYGYFPSNLPLKAFTLLLDGETLHGETLSGLLQRYPLLLLSFFGLVYTLIYGDKLLRLLACCVLFHFVLYFPYGDLQPNGLWRFNNIHYFKWTLPYLGLFSALFIAHLARKFRENRRAGARALSVWTAAAVLISSIHLQLDRAPVEELQVLKSADGLSLRAIRQAGVASTDFLDLPGLHGDFTDVYFGQHQVQVDAHRLQVIRDFRILPFAGGSRLLFSRPVNGRVIEIRTDPKLRWEGGYLGRLGSYRFNLGKPRIFWKKGPNGNAV